MQSEVLSWRERGRLWFRLGIRVILLLCLILFAAKLFRPIFSLFAPFVFALAVAALLNPLIRLIQRKLGWNRKIISLLVLVALVLGLGGLIWLLVSSTAKELISLAQNSDALIQAANDAAVRIQAMFQHIVLLIPSEIPEMFQELLSRFLAWLQAWIPSMLSNAATGAGQFAMGIPSFLLALLMFAMGTYFLTADYPYLRTRAISKTDETLLRFMSQLKTVCFTAFGGYLRAQLLLSVGVFFILLIGFFFTRQNYGLLLALGLAILDFIPIVGAGTVMVPWAAIALISGDYTSGVYVMIIWGVIALFRRVMEPKIVGDQTGISPILSLISIYVGMRVAGVAGMILAPIAVMIVLNLSGLGLFQGFRIDVTAAVYDLAAVLRQRPEPMTPKDTKRS